MTAGTTRGAMPRCDTQTSTSNGALIFDGAGRTTCLVVGVIAAAVTLVLELRRARART